MNVAFDTRLRPILLNPDARPASRASALSCGAVIVRQTNEQVKHAHFIEAGRKPGAETAHLKIFRPNLDGQ
jgi:hypothetical protein